MRALPFELQPQVKIKETPGIEPGTYRTAVDCSTPELYLQYLDTPSGTRTRNLQIRSLTRYPITPWGQIENTHKHQNTDALYGARTRDLWLIRPMLYQLS